MGWDLTGHKVVGAYMGEFPFSGIVTSSRVKYGGKVQLQVALDLQLTVYGRCTGHILVDSDEIEVVAWA